MMLAFALDAIGFRVIYMHCYFAVNIRPDW